VSEEERFNWVCERFNLDETVFVGDGYHDKLLLSKCALSFAPQNSPQIVKDSANMVTKSKGGDGVILEIALHLQDISK